MEVKSIVCPVSSKKIDSNVSRLTIFLNVLLMGFFIYTKNPLFIAVVSLDYFIRAVYKIEYSPVRLLAASFISVLKIEKKPINLAPKIFASRLGVICALLSLFLFFLGYTTSALVVAGVLMTLSTLDSVFNFCVGCMIYNYLVLPFYSKKN